MSTDVQTRPLTAAAGPGRHWSDWAGCCFYSAIAVSILLRSPGLGVLLLPSVGYELMVAASFMTRRPMRRQFSCWGARAAAYTGSFLLPVFAQLASTYRPGWLAAISSRPLLAAGALLWLAGTLAGFVMLWSMRRAFSVMPQARELVTTGPYRFARHPIYAAYAVQYLGIWLTRPTPALAAVLLLWLAVTAVRIRYEEAILTRAFPEYAAYRQAVPAFGLRVIF